MRVSRPLLEYQPIKPVDDLLDCADPRGSGGEPNLAAKTPKTEVTLLIHIILGQVAQIREGKQQYSTFIPYTVEIALKYAVRSEIKDAAIHQKVTELDQEGRSAGTTVSRRRCAYHPKEWKVLYVFTSGGLLLFQEL